VERSLSNTPLQALVTLNNDVFSEAARSFADRLLKSGAMDDQQVLAAGFQICMSRLPNPAESAELARLLATLQEEYQRNPTAAAKLTGAAETETTSADNARRAALTAVCRVLLNLDEFITRE
jgi:negative regulator of replication initiation